MMSMPNFYIKMSINSVLETKKSLEALQHQLDDTAVPEASDSVDKLSRVVGRSLFCDVCRRCFASTKSLGKHLNRKHKVEPLDIPGNNVQRLTSTVSRAHTESSSGGKDKQEKAQLICPVCGRQFSGRQVLASHLVTHTGARPAACRFPGCSRRFGQTSTRNYHERTHSEMRAYVCSQCGQSYKHPSILKTHTATMHGSGARLHQCSRCPKAFKLNGALQTHYRTVHMDKRPHSCTDCSKQFRYRSQLLRHVRALHSHERPWQCTVCHRTFTQSGNLQTHMRMHTGEKPYSCSVCGQNFAHSGTLKGHMATHCRANKHVKVNLQTSRSTTLPAVNHTVMDVPLQQLLPL